MAAFDLSSLIFQIGLIIGASALFRFFATRIREPAVLGEIVLGVILGPSLLLWAWPAGHAVVFPAENGAILEAFAWIGLLLFMYLAGSEMQWRAVASRATLSVSAGGLIVPLALGLAVAAAAPHWFFDGAARIENLLIVAAVMAVCALPVLARMLEHLGMSRDRLGSIAMGAGTIDDIVGWSIVALVVGAAGVGLTGHFGLNVVLLAAVIGAALLVSRYVVPRIERRKLPTNQGQFVGLLLAIFASALLTDAAGLHAVVGPLIVGAIVSRHDGLRDYAATRLRGVTMALFLPFFFVMAGADIDLTLLGLPAGAVALVVVVLVACVAKMGGAYIGARAAGMSHSDGVVTGILMNTRGAVGLATAKIAYDAGLLSGGGFALLASMVALTTFMAPPLIQGYWWWRRRSRVVMPEPSAGAAPRT